MVIFVNRVCFVFRANKRFQLHDSVAQPLNTTSQCCILQCKTVYWNEFIHPDYSYTYVNVPKTEGFIHTTPSVVLKGKLHLLRDYFAFPSKL